MKILIIILYATKIFSRPGWRSRYGDFYTSLDNGRFTSFMERMQEKMKSKINMPRRNYTTTKTYFYNNNSENNSATNDSGNKRRYYKKVIVETSFNSDSSESEHAQKQEANLVNSKEKIMPFIQKMPLVKKPELFYDAITLYLENSRLLMFIAYCIGIQSLRNNDSDDSKYKARGPLKIRGFEEYEEFNEIVQEKNHYDEYDFLLKPELAEEDSLKVYSACAYYFLKKARKCKEFKDALIKMKCDGYEMNNNESKAKIDHMLHIFDEINSALNNN